MIPRNEIIIEINTSRDKFSNLLIRRLEAKREIYDGAGLINDVSLGPVNQLMLQF